MALSIPFPPWKNALEPLPEPVLSPYQDAFQIPSSKTSFANLFHIFKALNFGESFLFSKGKSSWYNVVPLLDSASWRRKGFWKVVPFFRGGRQASSYTSGFFSELSNTITHLISSYSSLFSSMTYFCGFPASLWIFSSYQLIPLLHKCEAAFSEAVLSQGLIHIHLFF